MTPGVKRWHDALTARVWRRILVLALCAAPLVAGIASRFERGSHWFADFDAVACAGERLEAGLPIYVKVAECPGMYPSGYVYPPHVAQGFAWLSGWLGDEAWRGVYLAVCAASVLFLMWAAFLRRETPGGFWDRIPAFALITGSTIYWANIALPLHALICLSALVAHRRPWLFALALAAVAALKPVYLTYALVLMVLPTPLWRRLLMTVAAAGLGLAPTIAFTLTGGELVGQWREALEFYVYDVQPGDGFFGWLGLLGVDGRGVGGIAGWLLYAGLMSAAAMIVAACSGMSAQDRVWLGVGVGALVNPRLSPNDVIPLAILVGSVIAAARMGNIGDRTRRWIVGVTAGACCIGGLGNSLDAGDYAPKLFTLVASVALTWLAAEVLRREPERLWPDLGLNRRAL
ncbi:MAG: hypothetical protein SGJ21_06705 [Alphaproteobacteria bacterium]|nr:hypothetical protein [Alphaproteobacteria bacterium]